MEVFRPNEFPNGIPKQIRVLPIVEPPLQFVKVSVKMFGREFMIGTNDRPLEKAPHAFYGVGVDIPINPLYLAIADLPPKGIPLVKLELPAS